MIKCDNGGSVLSPSNKEFKERRECTSCMLNSLSLVSSMVLTLPNNSGSWMELVPTTLDPIMFFLNTCKGDVTSSINARIACKNVQYLSQSITFGIKCDGKN